MEVCKKDYKIKGSTKCDCGHSFNMSDFTQLKRLNIPGFYGNQIKHYSPTKCPLCNKETILLLKQLGQTYAIIDIAVLVNEEKNEIVVDEENNIEETKNEIEEENAKGQEFICTECQKVCKSQIGLNSHMKTHQV